jgi:dienelactone hydrolase
VLDDRLLVIQAEGGREVRSAADFEGRRREIRSFLTELLAELPKHRQALDARFERRAETDDYTRHSVSYFVEPGERVTAFLCVPRKASQPMPAILCMHQTVPQGKLEPVGLEGDPTMAFADRYARMGYATLAPDCKLAGERQVCGYPAYDTRPFHVLEPQWSYMAKMLWDHMGALDFLASLPFVDSGRLGCIGHSLGAYNGFFLAAFDERVQACVASCGFVPLSADENPRRWCRDNWCVHLPRLRPYIDRGEIPFDFHHVFSLVAPRALLLITGLGDHIFPKTEHCDESFKKAMRVYELLGAPDRLAHFVHDKGHSVPPEAQAQADAWLRRWLSEGAG